MDSQTTKRRGAAKGSAREDFSRFADMLAVLLEHPDTPHEVVDYIEGQINSLTTSLGVSVSTPAVLRVAFPVMCSRLTDTDAVLDMLKAGIGSATSEEEYEILMQRVHERRG